MNTEFNEEEVAKKIQERIEQLRKEDLAIDLCRGKGITLDKSTEIGDRQREIYKEISKLKTEANNPSNKQS